jgi:His/Glu/Gln/Arg/opine family amino acid ABC transporter permease subunit
MGYQWRFDVVWKHIGALLGGVQVTLVISTLGLILATVVGLLVAILRLQKKKYLDIPLLIYIDFFRTTPPLVQLIWMYYCLPILFGLEISAFWSGVLTLGLNTGAFLAEIFRGGILAVPSGQMEAARVLGLSYIQALRRIVVPQALILMLPPLGSTIITTIKVSSLVSVIAVQD